jgi:hypothetical protein
MVFNATFNNISVISWRSVKNKNNVKSLSGQNCKRFGFAPKDVLIVDTFLKTMLCVSFSICTFTINHNFLQFKNIS